MNNEVTKTAIAGLAASINRVAEQLAVQNNQQVLQNNLLRRIADALDQQNSTVR